VIQRGRRKRRETVKEKRDMEVKLRHIIVTERQESSVPDPEVFGTPGSGSFHHQAKTLRKPLNSTVLGLFCDFLSVKNDVNVSSKSNKQKKNLKIFWGAS
jgi:hypothetical protein